MPILGAALLILGSLWLVILAFRNSLLWGLLCLFVPFVSLLFAVTHWDEAKGAFFLSIAGGALILFSGYPFH